MSASCHVARVALYTGGAVAQQDMAPPAVNVAAVETCEYCDAAALTWRKCKQICLTCGQINRSCADL
jgi:hypothetical protein